MNAIEIAHLTKSYGSHRGIMDVSLNVEEGDFFGFMGPNGAGKSTTIRTLLGLITATEGSAKVLGMEAGRSRKKILRKIGYLPAETQFYPGMRVRDVLKFSADLHGMDCRKEAARLAEKLQLDTSRKVEELSLGNRKKVGIICAMQHRPPLYIMDEPTSGLDPLMQKAFYELLQERNQEGATVFLSSHILSEVQHYCRHGALIRDGRLLLTDTVENLCAAGTKKVVLKGVSRIPGLPGVKEISRTQDSVCFYYGGNIQALLQKLSELPVVDISVGEPDLEEIFLHFYEEEEK